MSYEPTTWQTGDVVTAEKMNKLEQGVANAGSGSGGGSLAVHIDTNGVMDKTYAEIKTAFENGIYAYVTDDRSGRFYIYIIHEMNYDNSAEWYYLYCYDFSNGAGLFFTTETEDGYPQFTD